MPKGAKRVRYQPPTFLSKFLEIHQLMWKTNNGLKSSHPYDSKPLQWPLLDRGIAFWRANPDNAGIYFIGNPLVWIPAALSILLYLGFELVDLILKQRQIVFSRSGYFKDMISGLWFFSIGYILHYFPFFLMSRRVKTYDLIE